MEVYTVYNVSVNVSTLAQQSFRTKRCRSIYIRDGLFASIRRRLANFSRGKILKGECICLGVYAYVRMYIYKVIQIHTKFPFVYKFFDQFGIDLFFRDSGDFLVIQNLKAFHEFFINSFFNLFW